MLSSFAALFSSYDSDRSSKTASQSNHSGRELASLLNKTTCDLREIAITKEAIDRLKNQLAILSLD